MEFVRVDEGPGHAEGPGPLDAIRLVPGRHRHTHVGHGRRQAPLEPRQGGVLPWTQRHRRRCTGGEQRLPDPARQSAGLPQPPAARRGQGDPHAAPPRGHEAEVRRPAQADGGVQELRAHEAGLRVSEGLADGVRPDGHQGGRGRVPDAGAGGGQGPEGRCDVRRVRGPRPWPGCRDRRPATPGAGSPRPQRHKDACAGPRRPWPGPRQGLLRARPGAPVLGEQGAVRECRRNRGQPRLETGHRVLVGLPVPGRGGRPRQQGHRLARVHEPAGALRPLQPGSDADLRARTQAAVRPLAAHRTVDRRRSRTCGVEQAGPGQVRRHPNHRRQDCAATDRFAPQAAPRDDVDRALRGDDPGQGGAHGARAPEAHPQVQDAGAAERPGDGSSGRACEAAHRRDGRAGRTEAVGAAGAGLRVAPVHGRQRPHLGPRLPQGGHLRRGRLAAPGCGGDGLDHAEPATRRGLPEARPGGHQLLRGHAAHQPRRRDPGRGVHH
mmetsp:Transcript_34877/g.100412  ORF Transcript_34877/g.100412 Transcript_34877/m.100412 type:complete len:494 (-) Transcript_34877:1214-2695(-)